MQHVWPNLPCLTLHSLRCDYCACEHCSVNAETIYRAAVLQTVPEWLEEFFSAFFFTTGITNITAALFTCTLKYRLQQFQIHRVAVVNVIMGNEKAVTAVIVDEKSVLLSCSVGWNEFACEQPNCIKNMDLYVTPNHGYTPFVREYVEDTVFTFL